MLNSQGLCFPQRESIMLYKWTFSLHNKTQFPHLVHAGTPGNAQPPGRRPSEARGSSPHSAGWGLEWQHVNTLSWWLKTSSFCEGCAKGENTASCLRESQWELAPDFLMHSYSCTSLPVNVLISAYLLQTKFIIKTSLFNIPLGFSLP